MELKPVIFGLITLIVSFLAVSAFLIVIEKDEMNAYIERNMPAGIGEKEKKEQQTKLNIEYMQQTKPMVMRIILLFICFALAGYISARLASKDPMVFASITAVLGALFFGLGSMNQMMFLLLVGVPGAVLGAYFFKRSKEA